MDFDELYVTIQYINITKKVKYSNFVIIHLSVLSGMEMWKSNINTILISKLFTDADFVDFGVNSEILRLSKQEIL